MADLRGGSTVAGFEIWHRGNMGAGSGMNADMLNGMVSATISTPNTIVARDASGNVTAKSFISDIPVGTAPFTVTSTTVVANLNADKLDDKHASDFLLVANIANAKPPAVSSSTSGTIGVSTNVARQDHNHDLGTHSHTDATNGGQLSHSSLANLSNDDHIQYIKVDGTRAFTGTVSGIDPTTANHLATKNYVDNLSAGLDVRASVKAASIAIDSTTTTGALSNAKISSSTTTTVTFSTVPATIDGITLTVGGVSSSTVIGTGDRILLKDFENKTLNGIYLVPASGSVFSRSPDANTSSGITPGMFTFVEQGDTNADNGWILTTDGAVTLGSTLLSFVQFSGAGQIIAGTGINKNGNTLNVVTGNITATSPLTYTGTGQLVNSTGTFAITQANTNTSGYLSSTDWNTFNNKQNAITTANLTVSGPLTITGGTDALLVATSISITQANTTTSGYLSSTDWNTFNNKQNTITKGNLTETTSSVLTITGGTGSIIGAGVTIQVKQATTSQSGYLSNTDWNTFNGKAPTNHASSAMTYGVADTTNYGHVKISDGLSVTDGTINVNIGAGLTWSGTSPNKVIAIDFEPNNGTSTQVSRADHTHYGDLKKIGFGTANFAGSASYTRVFFEVTATTVDDYIPMITVNGVIDGSVGDISVIKSVNYMDIYNTGTNTGSFDWVALLCKRGLNNQIDGNANFAGFGSYTQINFGTTLSDTNYIAFVTSTSNGDGTQGDISVVKSTTGIQVYNTGTSTGSFNYVVMY